MSWWDKAAAEAAEATVSQQVDKTTVKGDLTQIAGDAHITVVHGDQHHHTGPQMTWPVRRGQVPVVVEHFQHRSALPDLDTVFADDQAVVLTGNARDGAVVVSGMGGVGKTQLAAHHAHTAAHPDHGVDLLLWITATTRDAVITAYADTATHLHLSNGGVEGQAAADTLLNWLATTTRTWLIVLDDLQLPADLTGLWPPRTRTGRTLVTTRYRGTALTTRARTLDVDVFTPTEAHAHLTAELAEHPHLATDLPALAHDLGHLPLALAHAAAYIRDQETPVTDYRALLADTNRTLPTLFPHPAELADPHTRTTAATLSLSLPLAEQLAPRTAHALLRLASLLDPNGIPDTTLTNPVIADHLHTDTHTTHHGLRVLHRLNLITHDPIAGTVRVHALVQRVIRETIDPDTAARLGRLAANALHDAWPRVDTLAGVGPVLRANTAALHTHARHALLHPDVHNVLFRAGRSLGEEGFVTAARDYFHLLHEQAAVAHGPDHYDTLTTRNNLAHWRGEAGDAAGAAAAFEGLLTGQVRVLGADHLDSLATRHSLAHWRGEAGDAAGAAAAFESLLADMVRVLGPDHPRTLATRHSLANWRGEAGDAAGAAAEFDGLVTDQVRILGADHLDSLAARHNLARWRGEAGDAAGAAAAFEGLLAEQVRVLGADHPHTLATRHNLIYWRGKAGNPADAATALESLLAEQVRVLGDDYPQTLVTRHNLARWRGEAGDAAGAAAAFESLLADMVRVLGPDHPHTLSTRNNLAYWQE
ncbi:tetratricopeptide repeat protein [Actinokineospora bangkokensis]|uniref:Uncharacterized protein n=1 Tax=Actinokineospora bangkokensis TaxID=1193682 RepID=A0A1Q9LKN8_9PSEU|nr:tetratricopeptide repeat protein [Actinokineospora bangkokensis]OLR92588.1 hypothetical protein BJP25_21290 [Actinokineospora bangkokensis]